MEVTEQTMLAFKGVPCIDYHITPRRFQLDIPVEALAHFSPDAHTRMLAMLNAWITEHTPKPVAAKDKP